MSQREAPAAGLSAAIHLLGDILGHVISDLEPPGVFEVEEEIRVLAKGRRAGDQQTARRLRSIVAGLPDGMARAVASAFTVYFDLVNLAEDEHRVAILRKHEAGSGAGRPAPAR